MQSLWHSPVTGTTYMRIPYVIRKGIIGVLPPGPAFYPMLSVTHTNYQDPRTRPSATVPQNFDVVKMSEATTQPPTTAATESQAVVTTENIPMMDSSDEDSNTGLSDEQDVVEQNPTTMPPTIVLQEEVKRASHGNRRKFNKKKITF